MPHMIIRTGLHLLYHSQLLCHLIKHKQGLFHDPLHGSLPLIFHMNHYQLGNILACHEMQLRRCTHNNRRRQRNVRQKQDRDEIRQQAQAELMAAGIQLPQVPQIPDEPIQPAPAPPIYGPIHYEGAVGPHNFNNPLHYFVPNPAPPLPVPPGPDFHQFNMQFQHHFQDEQMWIRNDLLQRQAQEEFF
ncbi:hypothetical protein EDB19DRAFT_1822958 [Suillus lakei]|nr:hypothetical protein EDB19DRAFT_1822958 [Suillus lakei]